MIHPGSCFRAKKLGTCQIRQRQQIGQKDEDWVKKAIEKEMISESFPTMSKYMTLFQ